MDVRSRSWCFTWNNYPDDAIDALSSLSVDRIVVGKEVAPTTGTPHLQGYVRFKQPKKFSWWKNNFPQCSVQVRKGSEKQASDYCKKDGQIALDFGVDCDRDTEKGLTRAEEADIVMAEIDAGATFGQVRAKHRQHCYWYRSNVLNWGKDNDKIATFSKIEGRPYGWSDFR